VHAQQIAAIELFDRWLADHLAGGARASDTDRVREIIEGDLELDA
jgi:hypothetical protein